MFVVPPAFAAYDAVIAYEEVLGVNVILVAALAVVAKEDDITLFAQLLVPRNEPVNDPVNEPVFICAELDTVPGGTVAVAFNAYDAVIATDDDCAQLLVPINAPKNEPVAVLALTNARTKILDSDGGVVRDVITVPDNV